MKLSEYEGMLEQQGGVCAICGKPEAVKNVSTGLVLALAVDHDHESGQVRGLLCNRCNVGLGFFSTAQLLEAALTYLRRCESIAE